MTDSSTRNSPEWGSLTSGEFQSNEKWWPNALNLRILHQSHPDSTPLGVDFDYRANLGNVDIDEITRDVDALMTDSQPWWPADWGHYGPFFIRMSWHAAGTYRVRDGRGGGGTGAQRYAPLNSWPDNGNLDKARRLLLPIKQKYGKAISWADLFVFAGNRALETMGFRTAGFSFGREDIWAPEDDIYWGPENEWLSENDDRYTGSFEDGNRLLDNPLAAVQMGLIYVNPEGPNGVPDAMRSAQDLRETFGRMAMNDEETVALTVGGHTFGKMHGAVSPDSHGPEPEAASLADQGIGWANSHETGFGEYTLTSGLEGAWTPTPTTWDNTYLDTLFGHEWELTESPAGAKQWEPREVKDGFMVPDAHVEGRMNKPVMSTADMAMITDPAYLEISKRFHEDPDQLADAFAKAWFKLLHRDMGPAIRYVGPQLPDETFLWQDNVPAHEGPLIGDAEIAELKSAILDSGLSTEQLVQTAWAAASTYRRTDYRGGVNGARIRLAPMNAWDVNVQAGVGPVIAQLDELPVLVQRRGRCAGVARRPHRAGRHRRGRGVGEGRRPRHHRAVHAGQDRRGPGRHRRRLVPVAGAHGRRLPQLPAEAGRHPERAPAHRQGVHAEPDRAGDDGARRRYAGPRRERRRRAVRRAHRSAGAADQRLLRQPRRHEDGVGVGRRGGGRLRGPRPRDRRAALEGDAGRPRLRREQPATGHHRGVRRERRRGAHARRLRPRLGEGHGQRPLRPPGRGRPSLTGAGGTWGARSRRSTCRAVAMYAVGTESPYRSACAALLRLAGDGEVVLEASVELLQEFLHVRSRRTGDRAEAARATRDLAEIVHLHEVGAADSRRAVDLFAAVPQLDALDAVHAATALNRGIEVIVSADRAFGAVPDLRRLDLRDALAELAPSL